MSPCLCYSMEEKQHALCRGRQTHWMVFKQCNLDRAGEVVQKLRALVANIQPMRKVENEGNICIRCCYETFMML